jgi:hypothetical protein
VKQAAFRDGKANYNDIVWWPQGGGWKNQSPTPNVNTRYMYFFINTRQDGPVVVEPPPAVPGASFYGTIEDAWYVPLTHKASYDLDGQHCRIDGEHCPAITFVAAVRIVGVIATIRVVRRATEVCPYAAKDVVELAERRLATGINRLCVRERGDDLAESRGGQCLIDPP